MISFTDLMNVDLSELLEQRRQIALVWGVEDVQEVRPDLTDDQAWQVLQAAHRHHDCEIGLTWQNLEWFAGELFPEPDELPAEGDSDE